MGEAKVLAPVLLPPLPKGMKDRVSFTFMWELDLQAQDARTDQVLLRRTSFIAKLSRPARGSRSSQTLLRRSRKTAAREAAERAAQLGSPGRPKSSARPRASKVTALPPAAKASQEQKSEEHTPGNPAAACQMGRALAKETAGCNRTAKAPTRRATRRIERAPPTIKFSLFVLSDGTVPRGLDHERRGGLNLGEKLPTGGTTRRERRRRRCNMNRIHSRHLSSARLKKGEAV